ncbi:hypothetical protein MSAN_02352600 [Mycena sanguinolenta]|uniref:Uncharacterized protein n=1 Tax=Mycena sanguinolenta TaxID=230812 RepID=A0A8H6X620_9AGAR|nr:hypothetical protein MSAN_02352600 [Mycena sanguinolenta]
MDPRLGIIDGVCCRSATAIEQAWTTRNLRGRCWRDLTARKGEVQDELSRAGGYYAPILRVEIVGIEHQVRTAQNTRPFNLERIHGACAALDGNVAEHPPVRARGEENSNLELGEHGPAYEDSCSKFFSTGKPWHRLARMKVSMSEGVVHLLGLLDLPSLKFSYTRAGKERDATSEAP